MHATRHLLPGGRWHWQHGPIDLIVVAEGESQAVHAAHDAAWSRFEVLLQELVHELPQLRSSVLEQCPVRGVVARRMWLACHPYRQGFITPMAAVAGAVAQELIGLYQRPGITRAWVNNGGDIALHLAAGQSVRVGLVADITRVDARHMALDGEFTIEAPMSVRGIATSGWRGRSFSLGIADSVTVLAATAAMADAAATVIANAVNVDDTCIQRRPASAIKDDCDLGDLEVTVQVPTLRRERVAAALQRGQRCAETLRVCGLIEAAVLICQEQGLTVAQPLLPAMRMAA